MINPNISTKIKIAVVFDFDDTLVPDSTVQFLDSLGITIEEFKKGIEERVEAGENTTHAFLNFILSQATKHNITNDALKSFGTNQLKGFFEGLPEIFEELSRIVNGFKIKTKVPVGRRLEWAEYQPEIQFYIVSGGLEPLVRGGLICGKLDKYFNNNVVACRLGPKTGPVSYIERAVTFTEKTKYLYAINKGVFANPDPFIVNKPLPVNDRPVPFHNMIYIGDGFTDIPCFSMLEHNGGTPIAVVPQYKHIWESYKTFVEERRMNFFDQADYKINGGDTLGPLLVELIKKLLFDMNLKIKFLASSP